MGYTNLMAIAITGYGARCIKMANTQHFTKGDTECIEFTFVLRALSANAAANNPHNWSNRFLALLPCKKLGGLFFIPTLNQGFIMTLKASSASLDRLHSIVSQYYFSPNIQFVPAGVGCWTIRNSMGTIAGAAITQRRNRYRFES